MSLSVNDKEEIRERVYNAIDSGGSAGVSLKEICKDVFHDDDSVDFEDYQSENMQAVFNSLDHFLEEEAVSFNDEEDLWKCIGF